MLHRFTSDIRDIELPKQFTYPHHYTPHPLAVRAAEEVQCYIATRQEWKEELDKGKMFGVLVVETEGEIGFLAAYSGQLAGRNDHEYFVPAVYDMLRPGDFFKREEANISAINKQIKELESNEEFRAANKELEQTQRACEVELETIKMRLAEGKAHRNRLRSEGLYNEHELILQSQHEKAEATRRKRAIKERLENATLKVTKLLKRIEELKLERQHRSAELQIRLFEEFRMLNIRGEERDLCSIFASTAQQIPPSGTGECAAPKLLQYAFKQGMRPVAMAEFWWGNSPKGEVRRHGTFYPACNSKCKPILEHMLQGLDVEPNPLLDIVTPEPKILWEDESIVVIDKPSGMLSVRGKVDIRSAEEWALERYTEAMIVHRLDQSTSGILVIAKNKAAHEALQKQFIARTVKKSYVALLDGIVLTKSGEIHQPLKLDYDNRPRQMVATDGRAAHTRFEVEGYTEGRTRIRFYPITGRTHQLRVHAAHTEGLGTPIVRDEIYGKKAERLMLHAETLEFTHPTTGEHLKIECPAEF